MQRTLLDKLAILIFIIILVFKLINFYKIIPLNFVSMRALLCFIFNQWFLTGLLHNTFLYSLVGTVFSIIQSFAIITSTLLKTLSVISMIIYSLNIKIFYTFRYTETLFSFCPMSYNKPSSCLIIKDYISFKVIP